MRKQLAILALVAGAFSGCNLSAPNIPAVEAGVTDAEIAIQAIDTAADAYFAANPNAKLQTEIDDAATDAESLLRTLNAALAAATSMQDGNVQAALQAFSTAFMQLGALVAQIGIQVATGTSATRVHGTNRIVLISPPFILQNLKAKK